MDSRDARALAASATSVHSKEQLDDVKFSMAVERGDAAEVQRLMHRHRVNVCTQPDLLFVACERGHVDIVALLLAGGVPAHQQTGGPAWTTPLHVAAGFGHAGVVRFLLGYLPPDLLNEAAGEGTPLHVACERGHEGVVSVLLEARADVWCQRDNGTTPLYLASTSGYAAIVHRLLHARAPVDAAVIVLPNLGAHGRATPLYSCCVEGHLDVAALLLAASADANVQLLRGSTPLHAAVSHGRSDVVRALLHYTTPFLSGGGESLLVCAATAGQPQCIQALLEWFRRATTDFIATTATATSLQVGAVVGAVGTVGSVGAVGTVGSARAVGHAGALGRGRPMSAPIGSTYMARASAAPPLTMAASPPPPSIEASLRREIEASIARASAKLPSTRHEECLHLLRVEARALLLRLLSQRQRAEAQLAAMSASPVEAQAEAMAAATAVDAATARADRRILEAMTLGDLGTLREALDEVGKIANPDVVHEARARRDALRLKQKKAAKKAARRAEAAELPSIETAGTEATTIQRLAAVSEGVFEGAGQAVLPRVPSCPTVAQMVDQASAEAAPFASIAAPPPAVLPAAPAVPAAPTMPAASATYALLPGLAAPLPAAPSSEDDESCALCLDAPRTHLFVPCGHLCCCLACTQALYAASAKDPASDGLACPICRVPSTQAIRLFK